MEQGAPNLERNVPNRLAAGWLLMRNLFSLTNQEKKMKQTLIALLFLGLAACSHDHSDSSNGSPVSPVGGTLKKVSGPAECTGFPVSSLIGSWVTTFQSPEMILDMSFTFDGTMLTVSNTCDFQGEKVTATVQVPYNDGASGFTTLGSANRTEDVGGLQCTVSVRPQSVSYSFVGSCVVVHDPSQGDLYLMSTH